MKLVKGESAFTKCTVVVIFTSFLGIVSLLAARDWVGAASSGPSPSHTGAGGEDTCASCHVSYDLNSGGGNVQISGVPANYTPGQAVQVTVTTAKEDATIYGFQMTAIDGTGLRAGSFTVGSGSPTEMQTVIGQVAGKQRQYIEHTTDGLIPTILGRKSWTFTWTAPSQNVGRIDFFVAGNAADSNGSPTGDYIYTGTAFSLPAAAAYSVSGRVFTPDGITGLRNTSVLLMRTDFPTRLATTNTAGFFTFADVPVGSYVIQIRSRRYKFNGQPHAVSSDFSGLVFKATE